MIFATMVYFFLTMLWGAPPPSNSDHQKALVCFNRGIRINLHLPLLLGGGTSKFDALQLQVYIRYMIV